MCRLLGLVANKPVDLEFSLVEKFKRFSTSNPDGWGIGWYEHNSAKVFKEDISAMHSESQLPILCKEVKSKIIIAHVRKKGRSGAPPCKVNSHPFKWKNWLFAHNGCVDRKYLLSFLRGEYKSGLRGETDSEVYFLWILQCIEGCKDAIDGIKKALDRVTNKDFSALNFLLADGKCLYAFRYLSRLQTRYTLYGLRREPSGTDSLEFISQETKALLKSKRLKRERAVLVCSEPLTNEHWEDIGIGKILIIGPDLDMKEVQIL